MKKIFTSLTLLCCLATTHAQWNTTGNTATSTNFIGTTNNIPLRIRTNNVQRMIVDSLGRVGIGILIPKQLLSVQSSGTVPAANWITSGAPVFAGFGEGTAGNADFNLMMGSSTAANARAVLGMKRSRGTLAAPTAVTNNDQLGSLLVSGYDGTNFQGSAAVDFFTDGTPTTGNVPARISFVTGTNGSNRTERLKIGNTGDVTMNTNQFFLQKSSGNIGLGNILPQAKLDITGNIKIADGTQGVARVLTSDSFGLASWKDLSAANNKLSNLDTLTAINNNLLPDTTGLRSLGADTASWKNVYLAGDIYVAGQRFLSAPSGNNNFMGSLAGYGSTTGTNNTAGGYQALYTNDNGQSNTAYGYQSLYYNTGTYNTASAYEALYNNTIGYANSAYGAFSLYSNTTGSYNVAYGADALIGVTTGSSNTAVGLDALRNISTTSNNSGLGYYAASNTYSTVQGTFLGALTGGGTGLSNITAVGYGATATASNQVMLGNSSVTSVKAAANYVIYSDGRFKNDVQENVPGLSFINKLRPVTYHYNIHDLNKYIATPTITADKPGVGHAPESAEEKRLNEEAIKNKEQKRYTGFIAQEVEQAAKSSRFDFSGVYTPANSKDVYGLSYADFVVPLVKAVQELSVKNEQLETTNQALRQQHADQESRIAKLEAMMQQLISSKSAAPCPPMAGK